MRKILLAFASFVLLSSTAAFAALVPTQPCAGLIQQCQTAGFSPNGAAGKDVWMNCVAPTLAGKAVPNFTANATQVAACKNDISQMPCSKIAAACQSAGFTGGAGKLPLFDCLFPVINGKTVTGVTPSANELSACKTLMDKQVQQQPCLRVMLACKSAGFSPDEVNGQKFVHDCYLPVLNGQTVTGVTIDAATTTACKAETSETSTVTKTVKQ